MKRSLLFLFIIICIANYAVAQSTATKSYLNTQLQNQGTKGITSSKILNSLNAVIDYVDTSRAKASSPTLSGTVIMPNSVTIGNISSTELSYLDGVTSNIQTQLNSVQPTVFYPSGNTTPQVVPNNARAVVVLPTLFTGTTLTLTLNSTFHKAITITNYSTTATVQGYSPNTTLGEPVILLTEYKIIPTFYIYTFQTSNITPTLNNYKQITAAKKKNIIYIDSGVSWSFHDYFDLAGYNTDCIITKDGTNTANPSTIYPGTIHDNKVYTVLRGNAASRVVYLNLGTYKYNGETLTGNVTLDKEIRFMRVNDGTTTPYFLVLSK